MPLQSAEPLPDPDAGPVGQAGQAEVQRRSDVVQAHPGAAERVQPLGLVQPAQRRGDPDRPGPEGDGTGLVQHAGRHLRGDRHQAPGVVIPPYRRGTGGHRSVKNRGQDALPAARAERPPARPQPRGHARQRPASQERQHERRGPEPEPGVFVVAGQQAGRVQLVAAARPVIAAAGTAGRRFAAEQDLGQRRAGLAGSVRCGPGQPGGIARLGGAVYFSGPVYFSGAVQLSGPVHPGVDDLRAAGAYLLAHSGKPAVHRRAADGRRHHDGDTRTVRPTHAQPFGHPGQHDTGQESRGLISGQAVAGHQDLPAQQHPDVSGMPALEETPRRARPDRLQPGPDEPADRGPHAHVAPEVSGRGQHRVP